MANNNLNNKPGTSGAGRIVGFVCLCVLSLLVLVPIILVIINSFKSSYQISATPFELPTEQNFVGWDNYINGILLSKFPFSFSLSVFITVGSVILIVFLTAMTA